MIKLADVQIIKTGEVNYYLPPRWGLLFDFDGVRIPPCTMVVLPYRPVVQHGISLSPRTRRELEIWAGTPLDPVFVAVDAPRGRWHRVSDARGIEYVRQRGRPGTYRHKFNPPQPLVVNDAGGFAVILPFDCVIDYRGIVRP